MQTENKQQGWVKLYRSILTQGVIKRHRVFVFIVYCLLKASHKERVVMVGHQKIPLGPGQFLFGRKQASRETGLSEKSIRTCLAISRSDGFLAIKSASKFSVVTILNWATYQCDVEEEGPANRPRKGQQRATDKNVKNGKEEKPLFTVRDFFYEAYRRKTGKDYIPDYGKDGKIFKELLKTISPEELKAWIDRFFSLQDDFVAKNGFSVGMFRARINALRSQAQPSTLRPLNA